MKSQFAAFEVSIGGRLSWPLPFPCESGAANAEPAIASTRTHAAIAALNQVLIGFPPSWPGPVLPLAGRPKRLKSRARLLRYGHRDRGWTRQDRPPARGDSRWARRPRPRTDPQP